MSKVSLVKCTDYGSDHVYGAVKNAVDLLGGMGSFVRPRMKVLIKPNLLSARAPEEGVDTHPEVVRAVVKLVKESGGAPVIGDSPGGYGKNIDEVYEKSGMAKVASDEKVPLVHFTTPKFVDGIPIARCVFESDRIISIPKFKTHCITVLTLALKNTYGAVTGLFKAECHSHAPKEAEFAKVIAKVHSIVRPHLSIIDGITAMEGDGPAAGTLRQMNLIAASSDAVALDSVGARLVGVNPFEVKVIQEAYALKIGELDPAKIEIVGGTIEEFFAGDFKLPQTTLFKRVPGGIIKSIAALVRFKPTIDNYMCKRCNLCKTTCPVAAINIDPRMASIDYKKCVKCLCCHEVCPYGAITIRRNFLTKAVWG